MIKVYFSMDNGAGAVEVNEGNLGADDAYGFDEPEDDDEQRISDILRRQRSQMFFVSFLLCGKIGNKKTRFD